MLKQEEPWERVFFYELGVKYDRLQQYQLAELFYQLGIVLFPGLGLGSSLKKKLAALARVEYLLGKQQQCLEAYLLSLAYDASWKNKFFSCYGKTKARAAGTRQWRPLLMEQARFVGQLALGAAVDEAAGLEQGLELLRQYALFNGQEREQALLNFLSNQNKKEFINA